MISQSIAERGIKAPVILETRVQETVLKGGHTTGLMSGPLCSGPHQQPDSDNTSPVHQHRGSYVSGTDDGHWNERFRRRDFFSRCRANQNRTMSLIRCGAWLRVMMGQRETLPPGRCSLKVAGSHSFRRLDRKTFPVRTWGQTFGEGFHSCTRSGCFLLPPILGITGTRSPVIRIQPSPERGARRRFFFRACRVM
jgi:hypothetical protein